MDRQRALLHQGGARGQWGNLGLWAGADAACSDGPLHGAIGGNDHHTPGRTNTATSAPNTDHNIDYASACAALARAVGRAAGLAPGQRVLSVACGAGDELVLWAGEFGAAQVVGIEQDARAADQARLQAMLAAGAGGAGRRIQVLARSAMALGHKPTHADDAELAPAFDAIVCVDAAYHLSPRSAWLQAMFSRLRPGGRLAYTDLVLARTPSPWLRRAARLCGVPPDELQGLPQQLQRLRACGFELAQAQRLDDAVLGGFARFARRQEQALGLRPWQRGWRAVATTARLIPPCRAAGLGYALLSAMRPAEAGAAIA